MTNNYKYKIEYTRDTNKQELLFKVDFTSSQFKNTELVKDVIVQLNQLREQNIYQGINLVKIDGRISLPLAYVFAHEIQHYVKAIAFYYPQKDLYIVTNSCTPEDQIGDTINPQTGEKKSTTLPSSTPIAFTANCYEDTLNIDSLLGVVDGEVLIKQAKEKIDELINNGTIKGGKLLKINGKATVTLSCMIASKVAHIYGNVAIYDPKLEGYVVALCHGGEYSEGYFIKNNSTKILDQKKIVICGDANRGKTVLKDALKVVLSDYMPNNKYYVISGCPDGDGAWFNDAYKNNPEKAKKLKEEYKAKFTRQFAQTKAQQIRPINTPLLLFDVGGKINGNQLTPENHIIMKEATHVIIVGGNETEIAVWRKCCETSLKNLKVIAEITTKEDNQPNQFLKNIISFMNSLKTIISLNSIFLTIYQIKRDCLVKEYEEVKKLAKFLVNYK